MRSILGRHKLRTIAAAAAVLTLLATPSAGTTQNAGTTHNHDAHAHPANATAAVASAEPGHTATLNKANPTFTWEGSGSGGNSELTDPLELFRCTGEPYTCEYILLHIERAGVLTLTLDGTDGTVTDPTGLVCGDAPCANDKDIDGYLYMSNAAGDRVGKNLMGDDCASPFSSETCKVAVGPGFYLVEVEYYFAVDTHYIGTADLDIAPGPSPAEPQMLTVEGCNLTVYYFKDSAERLQALVPPGYRVAPYQPYLYPPPAPVTLPVTTEGSATIAAVAYDCDRIEVPGSPPAPGIFTVLSVLVYPPNETYEGAAAADFYVLWIHANNPQLVELLASRGMPASLVPGMVFEKPLQSLGVRVEVPWSQGAYELGMNGFELDVVHSHNNTYLHVAGDGGKCHGDGAGPRRGGCVVRMDFISNEAQDHYCSQPSDHHAVQCGRLTAQAGTPVAGFFGASARAADSAWDHEPLERAWFILR